MIKLMDRDQFAFTPSHSARAIMHSAAVGDTEDTV